MSTEQSRADFEIAFAKKCGVSVESIKAQRSGNGYWDEAHWRTRGISDAWYFWQKSRAALVVDINPQPFYAVPYDSTPGDHYNAGVEYAKKCLRAAGITVKEGA